tara:strand:- start:5039 stop:5965 length:927 start_codon:yes stop_codon:yes gene_type:complete
MPHEKFGHKYQFTPKENLLSFEEIEKITKILVKHGVRKIRITGGEPLLRNNIDALISKISRLKNINDISLTTNGFLLPVMAKKLRDSGLHRLTISLDSLDDEVLKSMTGRNITAQSILSGISAAEQAGFTQIKINTVVQRNVNDHSIIDIAKHFKNRGHIVRFIEYMDVGNLNDWGKSKVFTADEIFNTINAVMPLKKLTPNYKSEVALRYQYTDQSAEIGIIASVTKPFCGNCSRLRLSPEGKLFTCLFASSGTDIRSILRDTSGKGNLESTIKNMWSNRSDRYSEIRNKTLNKSPRKKIEMFQIGG